MTTDISPRLVLQQGGVISAFLAGAARSLLPKKAALDHSDVVRVAPPASPELLAAYAGWSRAAPGRYAGELPPHFVACQVALPVISTLTARSPYPLLGVLNQGIHLALHAPVPAGVPLTVRGHLVEAGDDGYRARIHSTLTVGVEGAPPAMSLDAYAAVVLKRRGDAGGGAREEPVFDTVGDWQAAADEGRKFFYLTGDFNPIHTLPVLARRTAFRGCIMHGYGAFAQVFEAIRNAGFGIADIDVRFVRPLPLPSPRVLVQVARTPGADGRRALRLVDGDGHVFQAGSFAGAGA